MWRWENAFVKLVLSYLMLVLELNLRSALHGKHLYFRSWHAGSPVRSPPSLFFLSFPPFKSSYIFLPTPHQMHDLFLINCHCMHICYIFLNITCSVCILFLACMLSGLSIWFWRASYCARLWEDHVSCSHHSLAACSSLSGAEACGLFPIHFGMSVGVTCA